MPGGSFDSSKTTNALINLAVMEKITDQLKPEKKPTATEEAAKTATNERKRRNIPEIQSDAPPDQRSKVPDQPEKPKPKPKKQENFNAESNTAKGKKKEGFEIVSSSPLPDSATKPQSLAKKKHTSSKKSIVIEKEQSEEDAATSAAGASTNQ